MMFQVAEVSSVHAESAGAEWNRLACWAGFPTVLIMEG